MLIVHSRLLRRRRRRLRCTRISRWSCILLLLLLLQVIRMRHVLHGGRRGLDRDQFDGTAILVDVDGFRWWRRVLLVVVGHAGLGDGDVLDWGGLAVVWLVLMVRVRL